MSLTEMLWIVCPLVFCASLMDGIAGGGGLISMPAYLLTGMPAHMAIGTNKFSAFIGSLMATIRFIKSGNYHLRTALLTAAVAVLGSVSGAKLALFLSDRYLRMAMLILLPAVAIFTLFYRGKFRDTNRMNRWSPSQLVVCCGAIGFCLGVYDGFFGPGTGTFMIIGFSAIVGLDMKTACGNAKIVNLTSNISALVVFILAGQVYYEIAIPAMFFSVAGGWVGSGLAIKKGAKVVKPMMYFVICLLFIKLIWDFIN